MLGKKLFRELECGENFRVPPDVNVLKIELNSVTQIISNKRE